MTKHARASTSRSIAAITWGVIVAGILALGNACWPAAGEADLVEPIRIAPSAAETALWVRDDSPSALMAVLPLMLQQR